MARISEIMKKDILGFGLLTLCLIGLGAFFIFAPKAPEIAYQPVDVSGGSITVVDQNDVTAVTLDAELVEAGWITIHESMGDAPAAIIGTSGYLPAGTYDDLVITLDQDMLPGYKYITLLHVDDGDKRYVTDEDLPARVNGAVVRPDFTAVPSAVTIPEPGSIPLEE